MKSRIGALGTALSLIVSPLASAGADPAGGRGGGHVGGGHAAGRTAYRPMIRGGHFYIGACPAGWRATQPL